mmetsp:Transcript_32289/g.56461  ORF Transcript_32289/g.56461 Transcript_32289/m.56461 type:complete len:264 (+) Transcript_32289:2-793(+)
MFAPFWTHLSVKYNYQLHQIFFGLESVLEWWYQTPSEAMQEWLPARLKTEVEDVAVAHFSGTLKMWDRDFSSKETDEQFARRLLRNCDPGRFEQWVNLAAEDSSYAKFKLAVEEREGKKVIRPVASLDIPGTEDPEHLVNIAVERAVKSSARATIRWREDLESCLAAHSELGDLPQLLKGLGRAAHSSDSSYWVYQPIHVYWAPDNDWYPAVVKHVNQNREIDAEISFQDWFGVVLRQLNPRHVCDREWPSCYSGNTTKDIGR